ncbi:MAG: hypothetical protein ACRETN_09260 [Nevskiales bacterium]
MKWLPRCLLVLCFVSLAPQLSPVHAAAARSCDAADPLLRSNLPAVLAARSGSPSHLLIHWYQRLARHQQAAEAARAQDGDWPAGEQNPYRLRQARLMLNRGLPRDAERALRSLREPLTPEDIETRQTLLAVSLMQQQRFAATVETLEDTQGFPRSSLYNHFNLATSLIGRGSPLEGMALLDELGMVTAEDAAVLTLRDRANLALGWTWLNLNEGASARHMFKRVRLSGLHSNMALLGLGWSELAPEGTPQRIAFKRELRCADVQTAPKSVRLLLFKSSHCRPSDKPSMFSFHHSFAFEPGALGAARFRRALAPWHELGRRDAQDPAVQEALLATGYAYEQLGASAQARSAYQTAVQAYEKEMKRLDALQTNLRGSESDPAALITEQTYSEEFGSLGNRPPFTQALTDLESLRQCIERRDASHPRRPALIATHEALQVLLHRQALDDLSERRKRLQTYLTRARLGLAAMNETDLTR